MARSYKGRVRVRVLIYRFLVWFSDNKLGTNRILLGYYYCKGASW